MESRLPRCAIPRIINYRYNYIAISIMAIHRNSMKIPGEGVSNAKGFKEKYSASWKFPGGRGGWSINWKASVEMVWVFSGARRLCIVSSFDKVCNDITMFLYRAKCEGRCWKKQWSGDHVCWLWRFTSKLIELRLWSTIFFGKMLQIQSQFLLWSMPSRDLEKYSTLHWTVGQYIFTNDTVLFSVVLHQLI